MLRLDRPVPAALRTRTGFGGTERSVVAAAPPYRLRGNLRALPHQCSGDAGSRPPRSALDEAPPELEVMAVSGSSPRRADVEDGNRPGSRAVARRPHRAGSGWKADAPYPPPCANRATPTGPTHAARGSRQRSAGLLSRLRGLVPRRGEAAGLAVRVLSIWRKSKMGNAALALQGAAYRLAQWTLEPPAVRLLRWRDALAMSGGAAVIATSPSCCRGCRSHRTNSGAAAAAGRRPPVAALPRRRADRVARTERTGTFLARTSSRPTWVFRSFLLLEPVPIGLRVKHLGCGRHRHRPLGHRPHVRGGLPLASRKVAARTRES